MPCLKIYVLAALTILFPAMHRGQTPAKAVAAGETLLYHPIQLRAGDKTILPWYSADLGKSFDFVINAAWKFWYTMRNDKNGLPYYMNHQVWRADFNDRRGVGGDQFAMALSSFNLLYGYTGNEAVKEEMKFIADYYLAHSLSPEHAKWPFLPYPYNTAIYSGVYDGDMVLGKGFTQPDKAGSFALELVKLYKITNTVPFPNITDKQYLGAAVNIANTLAANIQPGDSLHSPLPFKVNALNGEIGMLRHNSGSGQNEQLSSYTTNWGGTMELFLQLIELNAGNVDGYRKAFETLLAWMKNYPLKTDKWGPFFEDIPGWSDTQINAITFAQFMMGHREYFPAWQKEVKNIFKWVYQRLGNHEWDKYGVVVVNEQTAYQTPGNSHTSRQASAELQYIMLTGDSASYLNAVRQLSWATYMVGHDGRNCYPRDEVWMTDGYGDYIRHYLRAMAACPQLAPKGSNHLLSASSVIQLMEYAPDINRFLVPEVPADKVKNTMVHYRTFNDSSEEIFRLTVKPAQVLVNGMELPETNAPGEGWDWTPLATGGILKVKHLNGNNIIILKNK